MTKEGDRKTLTIGDGLHNNSRSITTTLTAADLEHLGTTTQKIIDKEDKLIKNHAKGKHGTFIWYGLKVEKDE